MSAPAATFKYDVFLSHSHRDKAEVESIAQRLQREGLRPFLDKWHLVAGDPWLEAIAEALAASRTVAVFVGPSGDFGSVQREEMQLAIQNRINDPARRVIPVLLPNTPQEQKRSLPDLLTRGTWIEFGEELDDEAVLHRLFSGIRGLPPGPPTEDLPPPPTSFQELRGDLFHYGPDGEVMPDVGVEVALKQTGERQTTEAYGVFRLRLPSSIAAGEEVDLAIDKPGWRVRYPLEGRVRVPARLDRELVRIELLPQGSPLFWTHDRIERWLAKQASASTLTPPETPADARGDLSEATAALAREYGFNVEEVRQQVEHWVEEVRARADDPHELGLAAFAQRSFEEAAQHFRASSERRLRERRRFLDETERAIAGDLRLEGDSYSAALQFDRALEAYRRADEVVDRERMPELWAAVQVDLGITMQSLGIRVAPKRALSLLAGAVASYRLALEVYTREGLPQEWARTQNSLGTALQEQGSRLGGSERVKLLGEAVAAYRLALEVRTREELPWQWAMTQNNLGNALQAQGIRLSGFEGVRLLGEAVAAYRTALEVATREELPQAWADLQNNLGAALQEQGTRLGGSQGVKLLREAVALYRAALEVWTRGALPQAWATAQSNLGSALVELGTRLSGSEGVQLLVEAVAACRTALEVRKREELPQGWAITQGNLGSALVELGTRLSGSTGVQLLGEAVTACRAALEVQTREELPQDWAMTQTNLGSALREQGTRLGRSDGVKLLGEAVAAYRAALEVFTEESSPHFHAVASAKLAKALNNLDAESSRAPTPHVGH